MEVRQLSFCGLAAARCSSRAEMSTGGGVELCVGVGVGVGALGGGPR